MLETGDQFTAVIGASEAIEELRRGLVRRGLPHAGASNQLRGLRRLMVEGLGELVIVCIAVDRTTIDRHGRALRSLLADLQGLPGSTFSVGLVTGADPGPLIAELGCDMYVGSSAEATDLIHLIRTESDLTLRPGGRYGGGGARRGGRASRMATRSTARGAAGRAARIAPLYRRGADRRTDRWHLRPQSDIDSSPASLIPPRGRGWMVTRHRWRRRNEGDWMN